MPEWLAEIEVGSIRGSDPAELFVTMSPIFLPATKVGCSSKKQATSTGLLVRSRSRSFKNLRKASLMLASFCDLSSRSLTSSFFVELSKERYFSAVDPYRAFADPSKGVPRNAAPQVLSTSCLLDSLMPCCLDNAFAHTRPPMLWATKMIGRSD
jgi:hypothetical protein